MPKQTHTHTYTIRFVICCSLSASEANVFTIHNNILFILSLWIGSHSAVKMAGGGGGVGSLAHALNQKENLSYM